MTARPDPTAGLAIVGMACLFPGAPDLETYWRNLVGGVDSVGDPPPDWHSERYLDPGSPANDRVYSARGGWLGDLATFEPLRYGVMPSSVDGGEPDQFLALAVATQALEDATGADGPRDPTRTGVIIGHGTYVNRGFGNVLQHGIVIDQTMRLLRRLHPEHSPEQLDEIKRELKAGLPAFDPDMAPGLVPNVMSGRIANRLDLMGPNFTVDAACASSLVALDLAVRELREGRCDLVLAGGVHTSTTVPIMQIFCQLGAVSRQGSIRPFDEGADGTLLGEGAGFVALKRLADAQADGDRIYAVVRSVGIASDGRASGLLAPRLEGEVLAIRRAYDEAGVDPDTVELVEAHGTGTSAGDEAELAALGQALGPAGPGGPTVALGAVKSMIAHLLPAAGIAGVIKTALALHHRVLPPTLHCEHPRAELEAEGSRLYLNDRARPWVHGRPTPRRAGVNAFGFGGINAHALLEEVPGTVASTSGLPDWPAEVVVLGAVDRDGLLRRCEQLLEELDGPLVEVARRSWDDLSADAPHRLAVVASTTDELATRLAAARDVLAGSGPERLWDPTGTFLTAEPLGGPGTVCFMFPGEGSPYPDMLAEVAMAFPAVRRWFDVVDAPFADHPRGFPPSRAIFPPPGSGSTEDLLRRMDVGPESLFAASQGLLALLADLGVEPDSVVGHSSGEWSALVAAGSLAVDDVPRLVSEIAALNDLYTGLEQDGLLPEAGLLTVGGVSRRVVDAVVDDSDGALVVALANCPHQTVLSGSDAAVDAAARELSASGAVCDRLDFGRAYHTSRFGEFSARVRTHLDGLDVRVPQRALYSCASAARFPADPGGIRDLAAEQWSRPVLFQDTVERLYDDGARLFVEVGPAANLTAFVRDTLRGRPHMAVSCDQRDHGLRGLLLLVATLFAHQVTVDPAPLFAGRRPPVAPTAPPLLTHLPDLGEPAPVAPAAQPVQALAPDRTAVLRSHLALMERFIEVQSSVLAAVGGTGPVAAASVPAEQPAAPEAVVDPSEVPTDATLDELPDVHAVAATLRQVLAERTGYPLDLLEADLDLEADLGIDSIKRVETLAAVQRVHGAVGDGLAARTRGLRTIRGMSEALAEAYAAAGSAEVSRGPDVALPFVDEVLDLRAPESARVRCVWDVAVDVALVDHTLEHGPISHDEPDAHGLPVVPLTMSLELAAEAALTAAGGGVVTALDDVVAHRWVALEHDRRPVLATASIADRGWYDVTLLDDSEDPAELLLTARVRVAADRPPRPTARPASLDPDEGVPPIELYGPTGLFHGPAFHVVRSIDQVGTAGAVATLVSTGRAGLLGRRAGEGPALDTALLDGPGQVLAHWLAMRATHNRDVFPVRIAGVELFAEPDEYPTQHRCVLHVGHLDDESLACDFEVVDGDGGVSARMTGWSDVRLDAPPELRDFLATPVATRLGESWLPPGPAEGWPTTVVGHRVRLPDEVLAHGQLWLRAVAHAVLGPTELATWQALPSSPRRRREWLSGRVAAKEAVRALLRGRDDASDVALRDLVLSAGEDGRPVVEGPSQVHVSITHSEGEAVALASTDPVGVDLQPVGSVAPEVEAVAFDDEETRWLDRQEADARPALAARLWVAKEAAAKATGAGLPLRPAELSVRGAADHFDVVDVSVQPEGPAMQVWTAVIDGTAYAACVTGSGTRVHETASHRQGGAR